MKRKKKKLKKNKSIKSKRFKFRKPLKKRKKISKKKSKIKRKVKIRRKKIKARKKNVIPFSTRRKKTQKTRAVVSKILSLSDKIKSMLRFNLNLDKSLQSFFQGISNRVSNIKKIIQQQEINKQNKIIDIQP